MMRQWQFLFDTVWSHLITLKLWRLEIFRWGKTKIGHLSSLPAQQVLCTYGSLREKRSFLLAVELPHTALPVLHEFLTPVHYIQLKLSVILSMSDTLSFDCIRTDFVSLWWVDKSITIRSQLVDWISRVWRPHWGILRPAYSVRFSSDFESISLFWFRKNFIFVIRLASPGRQSDGWRIFWHARNFCCPSQVYYIGEVELWNDCRKFSVLFFFLTACRH